MFVVAFYCKSTKDDMVVYDALDEEGKLVQKTYMVSAALVSQACQVQDKHGNTYDYKLGADLLRTCCFYGLSQLGRQIEICPGWNGREESLWMKDERCSKYRYQDKAHCPPQHIGCRCVVCKHQICQARGSVMSRKCTAVHDGQCACDVGYLEGHWHSTVSRSCKLCPASLDGCHQNPYAHQAGTCEAVCFPTSPPPPTTTRVTTPQHDTTPLPLPSSTSNVSATGEITQENVLSQHEVDGLSTASKIGIGVGVVSVAVVGVCVWVLLMRRHKLNVNTSSNGDVMSNGVKYDCKTDVLKYGDKVIHNGNLEHETLLDATTSGNSTSTTTPTTITTMPTTITTTPTTITTTPTTITTTEVREKIRENELFLKNVDIDTLQKGSTYFKEKLDKWMSEFVSRYPAGLGWCQRLLNGEITQKNIIWEDILHDKNNRHNSDRVWAIIAKFLEGADVENRHFYFFLQSLTHCDIDNTDLDSEDEDLHFLTERGSFSTDLITALIELCKEFYISQQST